MEDDGGGGQPRRGRRRSSSISISDLPDAGARKKAPPPKRSSSSDGRGHGIHRSVEKDMKVLVTALDSWKEDEDDGDDTDSSSADDSTRQWIKLILLGNSGVGKTSIMIRFDSKKFTEQTVSTTGVDFRTKKFSINRRKVNCQLWDTAGQERFCGITRAYYRDADGILIVYDVTDNSSLLSLDRWIEDLNTNASESCRKILLCNKIDLSHDPDQVAKGKALADKNGFTFCKTSAKSGQNVFKAIKHISREIIDNRDVEDVDDDTVTMQNQPLIQRRRCGCR